MLNRRLWLAQSLGAIVASPLCGLKRSVAADAGVRLQPNHSRDLYRVRIEMKLEGNVNVSSNPLVSRKSQTKLPVKSDAVFDYEERYRRPEQADPLSEITACERYYHEATSQSQLHQNEQAFKLRDTVRHCIVRRDMLPETVYNSNEYLTQSEVDLLRIPTSSVAVDRLLPTESISTGYKYELDNRALVSFLNLASIESTDVVGEVVEIDATSVKLQYKGKVTGSVDGVSTVIRIVGKSTFDRAAGMCTWLAMALHETREIGKAEPGFDISATIKMVRQPLEKVVALPKQPIPLAVTQSIPEDRLYVEMMSRELGLQMLMDRRWRLINDVPGSARLRMIENDRSLAQCDIRSLSSLQAGQQWTLEAFQEDVRRTLGGQMTQLVNADERVSDSGLRVLSITASGAVQGVPVQWIMQHFSDDSGRRIQATFTMDGPSMERFAGSDVQFANSLQMVTGTTSSASPSTGTAQNAGSATSQRVAKSNERKTDAVQSASDLGSSKSR